MASNLLEMLQSAFGNQLVSQASSVLGESPASTKSAVGAALPALLGGLMQQGSTLEGASKLLGAITGPNVNTGILSDLAGALGGGSQTSSLTSLGSTLLGSLFGDKVGALSNAVASLAGIKGTSATTLLGLAAPLVFSVVKRYVQDNRLDAGGLLNLLAGQGQFLRGQLDDRITGALGLGTASGFLANLGNMAKGALGTAAEAGAGAVGAARATGTAAYSTASRAAEVTRPRKSYLPWILAGVAGLILLYLLRGLLSTPEAPTTAPEVSRVEAPATPAMPSTALVYFESGKSDLPTEVDTTFVAIVEYAKANPGSTVTISGFHDAKGNAAQNEELAKKRAFAVRDYLKDKGAIAESRFDLKKPVSTTGSGDDREARRVEVSVK